MEIYKKTILNVYTMLYGKIDNLNEEVDNLIEFETRLAKIMRMPFYNNNNSIIDVIDLCFIFKSSSSNSKLIQC